MTITQSRNPALDSRSLLPKFVSLVQAHMGSISPHLSRDEVGGQQTVNEPLDPNRKKAATES